VIDIIDKLNFLIDEIKLDIIYKIRLVLKKIIFIYKIILILLLLYYYYYYIIIIIFIVVIITYDFILFFSF